MFARKNDMEKPKSTARRGVSVRFEEELYKKVVETAEEEGLSIGNMIEQMARYYLRIPLETKPTKRGRYK